MTSIVVSVRAEDALPYRQALRTLGVAEAEIRILPPEEAVDRRRLAAQAAGLVLTGGEDVEPWRYGEAPLADVRFEHAPERDAAEWELLQGAQDGATPVWGICRGMQIVNVFFGGTLWQDLPSQVPSAVTHRVASPKDHLAHTVGRFRPAGPIGRRLAAGPPEIPVNSRHHQAVKDLAPTLLPIAWAADGILEACHLADDRWWLNAVLWHPENLVHLVEHRALWQEFLRAVQSRGISSRTASAPS